MPFKIVKSIEKGSEKYEIVPEHWEKDGFCHWPKKDLSTKHIDENCPIDKTFYRLPCVVKRSGLTLQLAKDTLDILLAQSSTEESDIDQSSTRKVQMLKGRNTITKMNIIPDMSNIIKPKPQNTQKLSDIATKLTSSGQNAILTPTVSSILCSNESHFNNCALIELQPHNISQYLTTNSGGQYIIKGQSAHVPGITATTTTSSSQNANLTPTVSLIC